MRFHLFEKRLCKRVIPKSALRKMLIVRQHQHRMSESTHSTGIANQPIKTSQLPIYFIW
jgi:hypothetical protein